MKTILIKVYAAVLLFTLISCGLKKDETVSYPENAIDYATSGGGEYMCVLDFDNDLTYVPFCPGSNNSLGQCIGSYSNDGSETNLTYVFELKDYSSKEWIITSLSLKNCNELMIYREEKVTEIPDGLVSEPDYWWNQ